MKKVIRDLLLFILPNYINVLVSKQRLIRYRLRKFGIINASKFHNKEFKMSTEKPLISEAFQTFMKEAPGHAATWGTLVQDLAQASALETKTATLAYLAVLAALGLESGVPFHVKSAKQAGASREEVISAILIGLPAAGHGVTRALPAAVKAYDAD